MLSFAESLLCLPSSVRSMKNGNTTTTISVVDKPTHFRAIGKLKQLNVDGTQVVELMKPPHGPFGFYIARGNAKYNHGQYSAKKISLLSGKEVIHVCNKRDCVASQALTCDQRDANFKQLKSFQKHTASNTLVSTVKWDK